jgi:outer membrane lipoprotein-sorting protein
MIFLFIAITLVLVVSLSGCKSEEKTTAPPATQPAAQTTAASQPVATTTKPAATTTAAVATQPAVTTSKPPVTTTAAATTNAVQPAASGTVDKALQDLMTKSEQIKSMKFDMVMSNGLMTSKMYQKGHKSKMETNMMGMNMTVITDGDQKILYTWMVDQKKATKTDLTKETPVQSQANVQDFWDSDLVVTGTETLEGKVCTVVDYNKTTTEGKMTGKIWIWQEKGVPLRMDTTMTSTSEKGMNLTVTIEFKNYEFVDLEDSLFVLPTDVEIVDKLDFFPSSMPTNLPTNLPK